jgi:hypothetical protein
MTFSAGRQRRVASPFAQRAAQFANAEETPDISTIPDTSEPTSEPESQNTPEILEEHPEPSVESNNGQAENEVEGGAQEATSEPVADEAPAAGEDKPKSGRGRPKSADVQARDERVYDALAVEPGQTRAQLEEKLGLSGNDAYMSLFRLRTAGRIERRRNGGAHTWHVVEAQTENA